MNVHDTMHSPIVMPKSVSHCVAQNRLKGKIAVVTASTEGIGFVIAKRLAQEGASVIISSRRQEKVEAAVSTLKNEGLNVAGLVCHVAKKEDRKKLFDKAKEFGGLDILVSNAGVNPVQVRIVQCEEDAWNKVVDVNLTSAYLLAKEAYPIMMERGGGSIIFMSTILAYHPLVPGTGAYAVTKAGLLGLTKVLSHELGPDNIRVNCVAPGAIDTNFGKYIINNETHLNFQLHLSSIKRIGQPEDVSGVVAFLVSDDAQFITGETIVIAGGVHARL